MYHTFGFTYRGGKQSLPPQNNSFGKVIIFKVVFFQETQDLGKTFDLPTNCLIEIEDWLQHRAIIIDDHSLVWIRCDREEAGKAHLIKVPSVFHRKRWSSKLLFTKHLFFCPHMNCFLPLWSSKSLRPFLLSWRQHRSMNSLICPRAP